LVIALNLSKLLKEWPVLNTKSYQIFFKHISLCKQWFLK